MRHKLTYFNLSLASLTILTALITGCASGAKTNPVTTPTGTFSVASSTPASGATQVATSTAIAITFSEAANASTVNSTNITLTGGKTAVAGAVTYNATTYVATFTPTAALTAGTAFTLTVNGVTSSSGTALTSNMTSTFTTAAAAAPPPPTAQYESTLFPYAQNSGSGQVSVNTAGLITIQLTGATASTTYAAQFCPSYSIYTQTPYACIALGNVATTASGSTTDTTQFPQAGSWAGEFQLLSGSIIEFETGLVPAADANGVTQVYTSALQLDTKVNGKGDGATGTQGPLTSGSVTYSGGSLQFTLTGASPDTVYTSGEAGVLGGSSSYLLYNSAGQSAFTTDASGDVKFTVLQDGTPGDIFTVDTNNANSGAGYLGGFTVPAS